MPSKYEQAHIDRAHDKATRLKIGTVRTRYPGGDPENGPAYPQRWNGATWQCASHRWRPAPDGAGMYCTRCGDEPRDIEAEMTRHTSEVARQLESFTLQWYGPRCPDVEPECGCCQAWGIVDSFRDLNS